MVYFVAETALALSFFGSIGCVLPATVSIANPVLVLVYAQLLLAHVHEHAGCGEEERVSASQPRHVVLRGAAASTALRACCSGQGFHERRRDWHCRDCPSRSRRGGVTTFAAEIVVFGTLKYSRSGLPPLSSGVLVDWFFGIFFRRGSIFILTFFVHFRVSRLTSPIFFLASVAAGYR